MIDQAEINRQIANAKEALINEHRTILEEKQMEIEKLKDLHQRQINELMSRHDDAMAAEKKESAEQQQYLKEQLVAERENSLKLRREQEQANQKDKERAREEFNMELKRDQERTAQVVELIREEGDKKEVLYRKQLDEVKAASEQELERVLSSHSSDLKVRAKAEKWLQRQIEVLTKELKRELNVKG